MEKSRALDGAMLHRVKVVPAHFPNLAAEDPRSLLLTIRCTPLFDLPNLDWSSWQTSSMSVARSLSLDEDSSVEQLEDKQEAPGDKPSRHIKRRANVYDAVAGMFSDACRACYTKQKTYLIATRSRQPPRCQHTPSHRFPIPRHNLSKRSKSASRGASLSQTEHSSGIN